MGFLKKNFYIYTIVFIGFLILLPFFINGVRFFDNHLLSGFLKDFIGWSIYSENWVLEDNYVNRRSYSYLNKGENVHIAHALGKSGLSGGNSYGAFEDSKNRGFHLFEVDIFRGGDDLLWCHHGPEEPDLSAKDQCNLLGLLSRSSPDDYFILDIKNSFEFVLREIISSESFIKYHKQLIFQLYSPGDIRLFVNLSGNLNLPAPIITVYKAHRSPRHIMNSLVDMGYTVIVVPLEKLPSVPMSNKYKVFVHPVHNCLQYNDTRSYIVSGYYVTNSFDSSTCNFF